MGGADGTPILNRRQGGVEVAAVVDPAFQPDVGWIAARIARRLLHDAAGLDVIEVGILLANPADFAGLNEEYARWFPADPPTRYVANLGVELPGLLVSIRMTAFTT